MGAACSFSSETFVATESGFVPIGEVDVGDFVLAWDQSLDFTDFYTVTAVWAHFDSTVVTLTIDGEEIETTPEHPFYIADNAWVAAGELWLGATVRQADGGYGTVSAISVVQKPQVMYNLTVEGAHTYHVGQEGWLVHNNCHPLHDRAEELHDLLNPQAQRRTTTATASGRMPSLFGEEEWIFVASSERRLPRVQREALTDREYPVRGEGHAEETIINFIRAVGGELDEIAASRPICRHTCLPLIQQDGIRPVSPIKP